MKKEELKREIKTRSNHLKILRSRRMDLIVKLDNMNKDIKKEETEIRKFVNLLEIVYEGEV